MRNLLTGCKMNYFIGIALFVFATFFFMNPVLSEASEETELGDQLLIEGKDHEHVSDLQELLIERGYITDSVSDGLYDSATREAVIDFQESAGIFIDGIAGTHTIGALSILKKGDEGKVVLALQNSLSSLGYYDAKRDGVFGPVTHEAVTGFQKAEGIVVDGLAGPKTYGALHKTISVSGNSSSTSTKVIETKEETTETAVVDTSESSSSDEVSKQETKTEPVESSSEVENAPEPSSDENTNTETKESPSTEEATEEVTKEVTEEATETSRSTGSGGNTMTVEATAYTAYCNGCSGTTATGIDLRNNPGKKVIAVDPSVIPLGSTVEVEGYGTAIAGDTGGAIKGNKIDLFMSNREDALNFGRRNLQITVLE